MTLRSLSLNSAEMASVRATAGAFDPLHRFGARVRARFSTTLAAYIDGVREARDLSARYDALAGMSPAELAKLGLTRRDISRVVGNSGLAA